MNSFYQYGNVLLQDHDHELAEISTTLSKMNQNEKNYLELMDNNNDIISFNVNSYLTNFKNTSFYPFFNVLLFLKLIQISKQINQVFFCLLLTIQLIFF